MSGRAAVPKSRAGETARRVKKSLRPHWKDRTQGCILSSSKTKAKRCMHTGRSPRYHFVCCFQEQPLARTGVWPPIRCPVTWAERPRATAQNGVHAGCSQVRADRTVLPPCTGMAALCAQGMRKVMSCSLHLPNDCVYFSPDFIICQYILGKLGDSSIFAAAKIRNFRRFLFKREMNKTEHDDR